MVKTTHNAVLRLRPTTAKAIVKAATLLFDVDAIDFDELATVRVAMNALARRGELPSEPEKRLLDLHSVAEKLAIGESTLKRMLADGTINLPKVRIGGNVRFRLADVERLIDDIEMETDEKKNIKVESENDLCGNLDYNYKKQSNR